MTNAIVNALGQSYTIGEYIDKGSFSEVYELRCFRTGKKFAGKFVSKEQLKKCGIGHKVWDEIKIHQRLRHKHVVQFHGYVEREQHVVLVLEYCSQYSLAHVLHAEETLRPGEAKYFMLQLVSAVDYLHRSRIVHRDLKLGNSFLTDRLQVKLGDFGLAAAIEYVGQQRFSKCGTPNYIAPEVVAGRGHSYEVDVWALGCALYTLLEGAPPFQATDAASTYGRIARGEYRLSAGLDGSAKLLIAGCLQPSPGRRPRACELARAEFLAGELRQEAPRQDLAACKALSPSAKRRRKRDATPPPPGRRFPLDRFARLADSLADVVDWRESELVSARPSAHHPAVWVNCWSDFTNSFGFAYRLSTGALGAIFNNASRMLLVNHESVHFAKKGGSTYVFNAANTPKALRSSLNGLISCGRYMDQALVFARKEDGTGGAVPRATVASTEVFAWTRNDTEAVMFLSNGSLQVNFFQDHAKLVLCAVAGSAALMGGSEPVRTFDLEALRLRGCGAELKRKLLVARRHLRNLLDDQAEEPSLSGGTISEKPYLSACQPTRNQPHKLQD